MSLYSIYLCFPIGSSLCITLRQITSMRSPLNQTREHTIQQIRPTFLQIANNTTMTYLSKYIWPSLNNSYPKLLRKETLKVTD